MLKFIAGAIVGAILRATTGALAVVYAEVNTNGMLKGYIVQDKRGREVCRNPLVQLQFRGRKATSTASDHANGPPECPPLRVSTIWFIRIFSQSKTH